MDRLYLQLGRNEVNESYGGQVMVLTVLTSDGRVASARVGVAAGGDSYGGGRWCEGWEELREAMAGGSCGVATWTRGRAVGASTCSVGRVCGPTRGCGFFAWFLSGGGLFEW
ncbi:hypothetical protein SUGI_0331140 [Cryptomeria japonica]|nr:hypothetical protein SUGI_0331140 [Cryptomeria japonica]